MGDPGRSNRDQNGKQYNQIPAGVHGFCFQQKRDDIIKQDIKEGIAYGIDRAYTRAVMIGTDPYLIGRVKQLVKESVDYSAAKTGEETGAVMDEHQSKQKNGEK